MLYTRKGDTGTSGLYGTKERVPKNSAVYEALGGVDELNSLLGLCRASAEAQNEIARVLLEAQERLFILQAELAGSGKVISPADVLGLEDDIALFETRIRNPHAFVIPGATVLSGMLDYARAVARRVERVVVGLSAPRAAAAAARSYLNRLSSLLYVLARYAATLKGVKEASPHY